MLQPTGPQPLATDDGALSVQQFGALFNLSDKTIYRHIRDGKLKVIRIGNARLRIPRSEVRDYPSRMTRRAS